MASLQGVSISYLSIITEMSVTLKKFLPLNPSTLLSVRVSHNMFSR